MHQSRNSQFQSNGNFEPNRNFELIIAFKLTEFTPKKPQKFNVLILHKIAKKRRSVCAHCASGKHLSKYREENRSKMKRKRKKKRFGTKE